MKKRNKKGFAFWYYHMCYSYSLQWTSNFICMFYNFIMYWTITKSIFKEMRICSFYFKHCLLMNSFFPFNTWKRQNSWQYGLCFQWGFSYNKHLMLSHLIVLSMNEEYKIVWMSYKRGLRDTLTLNFSFYTVDQMSTNLKLKNKYFKGIVESTWFT